MELTCALSELVLDPLTEAPVAAQILVSHTFYQNLGRTNETAFVEKLIKLATALILYTRRKQPESDCIHFMRLLLTWIPLSDYPAVLNQDEYAAFADSESDNATIAMLSTCLRTEDPIQEVDGSKAQLDVLPSLPGAAGAKLEKAKGLARFRRSGPGSDIENSIKGFALIDWRDD